MAGLKRKIIKTKSSYCILIPRPYLKALKIDKKPLDAKFKMMTDGRQILLRKVKNG